MPLIVRGGRRRGIAVCDVMMGQTHAHGSPLCQVLVEEEALSLVSAGSGSDFSEEPVWGCELVTLEFVDVPRCPPGPVIATVASSSICR